jgi:predicted RNA methylase
MNHSSIHTHRSIQVVLDVGSGTGILSMFAAKAGARLVYAVDACPNICKLAEELITCNHLQNIVRVMNQRVEHIDRFEQPIDIIISEWMGRRTTSFPFLQHLSFQVFICFTRVCWSR